MAAALRTSGHAGLVWLLKNFEHRTELAADICHLIVEVREVAQMGSLINVQEGVPYDEQSKHDELMEALAIQQILRSGTNAARSMPTPEDKGGHKVENGE